MEQMVFVALKPKKIARHLEERRREIRDCLKAVRDFRHSLDWPELHRVFNPDGTYTIRGFAMESAEDELPVGWMREGESLRAVPDPLSYDGQKIRMALADLSPDIEFIPGTPFPMISKPHPVTGKRHRLIPKIKLDGGDYFLILPEAPCSDCLEQIDPEYWEPAGTPAVHFIDQRVKKAECDV